ncbi:MAG: RNA-binding protein [Treponema sp.]|nr:RNA-binding protein [Treponema sp.]
MRLYVGNLSYSTTEETLREAFSNYGEVVSVQIMKDKFTEQSKGFGFVEMADDIMGERGIGGMNGKSVDGRRIRVSPAVDKPRRPAGARRFFKKDGESGESFERPSRGRKERFSRDDSGNYSGKAREKSAEKFSEKSPSEEY